MTLQPTRFQTLLLTGLLGLPGIGCGLFEDKDGASASHIDVDEPGRVVAIVNGMPVMEIDFHWAIQQARENIGQRSGFEGNEERTQQLKEEGMTALIRGAILLQEAKKRDIDATATEIATAIQNTASPDGSLRFVDGNGVFDQQAYQAFLAAVNITESQHQRLVRKDIRRQKTRHQMRNSVSVSDDEIWSFYQEGGAIHSDTGQPYLGARQYSYSYIRVPSRLFNDGRSDTQARRKAREEAEYLHATWRRTGQPPHAQLRALNAKLSPLPTIHDVPTRSTDSRTSKPGASSGDDSIEQIKIGLDLLQPDYYAVIYLQAVDLAFPQIMDGHCTEEPLELYEYDKPGTLLDSVEWVDGAWCVQIDRVLNPTRQDFESADIIDLGIPQHPTSGQSVQLTSVEFREWARQSVAMQSIEEWLNGQVAEATVEHVYTPED